MREDEIARFEAGIFEGEVTAAQIAELDSLENLRLELDAGLTESLNALEDLYAKLPKEEARGLLEQCMNNATNAIVGQFGLASVVLGAKDGGNVTTTHNFEQGITANEVDRANYEQYAKGYDRSGYDAIKDSIRDKSPRVVTSEYSGAQLERGQGAGKAQLDHIKSVKEFDRDPRSHLFLTKEQRQQTINDPANLAWMEGCANNSKGEMDVMEWGKIKNEDGRTNFEKYGYDEGRAKRLNKRAKEHIDSTLDSAKFRKYSSEVLYTSAKDAGKMAIYTAVGEILRELVAGLGGEVKLLFKNLGDESLSEIFSRFKEAIERVWARIQAKWKNILAASAESGILAFFSNIVVFVTNAFFTTFQSLVRVIRAGFVSLYQAVKIILNPPPHISKDDVLFEASKILVAGLISACAMLGAKYIEDALLATPGLNGIMMLPIPFSDESIGSALSLCLSAALGAILSSIAIYFMDKAMMGKKVGRLQLQIVAQSGVVVQYKAAQSWFCLYDAYQFVGDCAVDSGKKLIATKESLAESSAKIEAALDEEAAELAELEAFYAKNLN